MSRRSFKRDETLGFVQSDSAGSDSLPDDECDFLDGDKSALRSSISLLASNSGSLAPPSKESRSHLSSANNLSSLPISCRVSKANLAPSIPVISSPPFTTASTPFLQQAVSDNQAAKVSLNKNNAPYFGGRIRSRRIITGIACLCFLVALLIGIFYFTRLFNPTPMPTMPESHDPNRTVGTPGEVLITMQAPSEQQLSGIKSWISSQPQSNVIKVMEFGPTKILHARLEPSLAALLIQANSQEKKGLMSSFGQMSIEPNNQIFLGPSIPDFAATQSGPNDRDS